MIVAFLALFFSLAGAGFAASHYVITSTSQIKPSVRAQLAKAQRGRRGPRGPAGPEGPQGKLGLQGLQGLGGVPGPTGPAGSQGEPGNIGRTGNQGETGLAGATGATGAAITGPTGPTGPSEGPTGPTGAEGKEGKEGNVGPTGPAGSGGGTGGSGTATSVGTLEAGKSETGGWAAWISASSGAQQVQAEGVVSLPIKLEEYEAGEGITLKYRNAEEALKPEKPCLGSVEEPIAEKGFLCAYRGGAGNGSKENEDLNVTKKEPEVFFQTFFGQKVTEIENVHGNIGVDIVFRTLQFNATGTGPPATLTANSYMAAQGSWAVTAR